MDCHAMITKIDNNCSIFFGNASMFPIGYKAPEFKNFCEDLRKKLGLDHLVIQNQLHGIDGWYINNRTLLPNRISFQERDGDFLITNQPMVGIGVLTADCLPIIFYAPSIPVIAIAHAGWRGSVANICKTVIEQIKQHHPLLNLNDIQIYFGPSAGACCYEVKDDFLHNPLILNFAKSTFKHNNIIHSRDGKKFFDNTLLNKIYLIECGIKPEHIHTEYNLCTICNRQFHSYRRSCDKPQAMRQSSIVWLHEL